MIPTEGLYTLGERIKFLRLSRGWEQTRLARVLGVMPKTICLYETGMGIPNTKRIVLLAHIFRVSTDYLLGSEKELKVDISRLSPTKQEAILRLLHTMEEE